MLQNAEDVRFSDVIAATERILVTVQSDPIHVRPWLRGIEFEAERVLIDLSAARRRANRRFLSWLCWGADDRADFRESGG